MIRAGSYTVGMPLDAQSPVQEEPFSLARAYWNHRNALAGMKERISLFSRAADDPISLSLFQFVQLAAATLEFRPDLILELGRGAGNSTCLFTEAAHRLGLGPGRVLSLDIYDNFAQHTVPRLQPHLPADWFTPLAALRQDILKFDFHSALAPARRILVFWDAHGFDVAECILGAVLPEIAGRPHLVMMHDMGDLRYGQRGNLEYGEHGIWKKTGFDGPRLKLGFIDSAVEQAISIVDFATRNKLPLHTADDELHSAFASDPERSAELQQLLGEMHSLSGHWLYFSLNEAPGQHTFPRFDGPGSDSQERQRPA
jgi:hypothetical protein